MAINKGYIYYCKKRKQRNREDTGFVRISKSLLYLCVYIHEYKLYNYIIISGVGFKMFWCSIETRVVEERERERERDHYW